MFKFMFVLTIVIFAMGAAFFDFDQKVEIEALNYNIQVSLMFLISAFVVAVYLLNFCFDLIYYITGIPNKIFHRLDEKKYDNVLTIITKGFDAISSDNLELAKEYDKKILQVSNLPKFKKLKSIFLLFKSNLAETEGDIFQLEDINKQLLEIQETSFFALKNLINIRIQQHNYKEALVFAKQAHKLNSKSQWLLQTMYSIYFYLKEWREAKEILDIVFDKKYIDLDKYEEEVSKTLYNWSLSLHERGDTDMAINKLKEALVYNKTLIDAILFLLDIYLMNNKKNKALDLIKDSWLYVHDQRLISKLPAIVEYNEIKLKKYIDDLIAIAPSTQYSYLILAKYYLSKGKISAAKEVIDRFLEQYPPTSEIAKLATLIEAKQSGANEAVLSWLNKIN